MSRPYKIGFSQLINPSRLLGRLSPSSRSYAGAAAGAGARPAGRDTPPVGAHPVRPRPPPIGPIPHSARRAPPSAPLPRRPTGHTRPLGQEGGRG